ncbi:MAG TPA: DNA translocase FtsK 4TM domain-containing protein, partial [Novosphingobium sp.]|nr:DNA translocase FtsK 4TM domain-containing protein [Novosphingobium sp.]
MASRAIGTAAGRTAKVDWRTALRRSLRRAAEIGGALVLFATMVFLAIALATYRQTDPSMSTAAGGDVHNWMGAPGAWAAERALFFFGLVSVLLLPLLYVLARKLWRMVEEEDGIAPPSDQRWWRPTAVLLLAMTLLGTVLSLAFTAPGGSLPASMGGVTGLLGA